MPGSIRCHALAVMGATFVNLIFGAPVQAQQTPRKPNIIVIVGDDLGYGELGCYGGKEIPTPHLDTLAKNGVRCTNGYVSCPVCSPTRAGLMTGRYQQRFGHEFNPGPEDTASETFGLPLSEVTLANRLKSAGYATGIVGKWHLGYKEAYQPQKRGFDEFFGFLSGSHPYFLAGETTKKKKAPRTNDILRGTESANEKEYLTDAFTREAVAYVERHKQHPFLLYLTYNAVHNPLQATEKYLSRFTKIEDDKRRTFAAMLSAMDDGIGAVLAKLKETGLENDTLIFFVSDNGGPTPQTTSRNDPLGGRKGQVLEGGIRVPYIVQWKGHLPAGKTYDQPVIALDIHPTAMAAAGAPVSADAKLDGVNLLPYLSGGKSAAPHEALFWRFGEQSAVRKGNWKLVKQPNAAPQLFDLAGDIGEKTNHAGDKPEVLQELQAALGGWDAQLAKPLWRTQRQ